jgi:tRNA-specific 2-thiouridylase
VLCNDHLKFDTLLERMHELGGDKLATGHYARIEERDGRYALLRGVDRRKDQSYFLFGLKREVLRNIIFPLGNMTKPEVRELATELGVPTATKPESQDICFVADGHYANFVEERLDDDEIISGEIKIKSTGEVLGEHDGIHQFTIGQRRGLGVSYSEPVYVKSIDSETGTIWVDVSNNLGSVEFYLDQCNWLKWDVPPEEFETSVQVRYRHSPVAATVIVDPDDPSVATVRLPVKERAITPGQAAVFYDGEECVGGGWVSGVQ